MRTIIYFVTNKETNKSIYSNCRLYKCEEKMNSLEDKENYKIQYKWMSF